MGYSFDFPVCLHQDGLDPHATHTIKIVARGDKNVNSRGTLIKHMGFEYGAESYWASAGFSSVATKNNWRYQSRKATTFSDLSFNAPLNCWLEEDQCIVGNNYQMPLSNSDAVRKWVAPHDGNIRIEGAPAVADTSAHAFAPRVLKNAKELWSAQLTSNTHSSSHDMTVAVRKGDAISFVVHSSEPEHAPDTAQEKHVAPLKIGTEEFACGMNCHAISKVVVPLPGPGKTFSAIVGQDADATSDPGVKKTGVFSVLVGDKAVFKSDALKGTTKGVPVNVDLGGAREFVLEVSDGGNGIGLDWANWGDAKATLADGKEIWLADLRLKGGNRNRPRVDWDPVITYVDATAAST